MKPPVRAPGLTQPTGGHQSAEVQSEELEPSELWLALTATPRPSKTVPFPRKIPGTATAVGDVAIWPLTVGEIIEANAAAEDHLQTQFKNKPTGGQLHLGYQHSYAEEVAVQQLWRACRTPNDLNKPAFPSPKMIRKILTGDETGVLYNNYLTIQSELGPITATMSDEEYEAIVRRVAEGGSADPLDSLSWDLRATLELSMALQLVAFWTATSSAGSPLAADTSLTSSPNEESDPLPPPMTNE